MLEWNRGQHMELGLMLMHEVQATAIMRIVADLQATSPEFELSAPRATLIAACIAAAFSFIGAMMTRNAAKRQKQGERNQKEIENCRKQLGDLYGPLSILRLKSRRFYEKVRDEMNVAPMGQQDWRLVDHIVDVQKVGNPAAKSAVTEILKINDEIETLITKNAGRIG
jgi:hypothetical protein